MDLSKAFDCLPHDLLLLKVEYYGLSKSALNLLKRKQCVKIGQSVSEMLDIYIKVYHKGLYFTLFNDIFLFVKNCDLYNYADMAFLHRNKH